MKEKTGLVLEGGGMRGIFTAGVLDVMMEQGIKLDGAMGVSAGAVFGCNYKSGQIGRSLRYNTRFCADPRYWSLESLVRTGDLFGVKFCYDDIPNRLDPFDAAAYRANPMPFYAVCTNVETGKAIHKRLDQGEGKDMEYFRASASMPVVSRIVEVDGYKLLDGGIVDSIPLLSMERRGYPKNVVILTQPIDYVKKQRPEFKIVIHAYPDFKPLPLYGNLVKADYCGQTVAWYFQWPEEKIQYYTKFVTGHSKDYYPHVEGIPFQGVNTNSNISLGYKTPADVEREIRQILAAGGKTLMVCDGPSIIEPGYFDVFKKYCGKESSSK